MDKPKIEIVMTPEAIQNVYDQTGIDATEDMGIRPATKAGVGPDDIVVMMRVGDSRIAWVAEGSRVVQCADCGHDAWLAPTSPQDITRICMQCAGERLREALA